MIEHQEIERLLIESYKIKNTSERKKKKKFFHHLSHDPLVILEHSVDKISIFGK